MAKVIEQIIAIKISRMIKDDQDENEPVLSHDQEKSLLNGMAEFAESIIDDHRIIVEMIGS